MTEPEIVEVRCPVGPRRLFAKLRLEGGINPHVTEDNLVEFSCDDCKRERRARGERVFRVLHRFDFFGTLVQTVIDRGDGSLNGR